MKLRVWIKSRLADRALAPLRSELAAEIENGATLLEVGCGTGAFMFHSASIISRGYGIDLDCDMIKYANQKCLEKRVRNLEFACVDATTTRIPKYDVSTSTLCLHELREEDACAILRTMVNSSNKVLIADYTEAKSLAGKLGIEIDELVSGHYRNYKNYRKRGEIPIYVKNVGARIEKVIPSVIDGITIWDIRRKT